MAAAKKTSTAANPLMKTYGERPIPFQFPGNQEKMYIGSEVCIVIVLSCLINSQLSIKST
jgi:hypothetical protein